MDAALTTLKLDKKIAAAEAQSLESTAAELERGFRASNIIAFPSQSPQERTSQYVEHHFKAASEPILTNSAHHQPQQYNTAFDSGAPDLSNGGLNMNRPCVFTRQPGQPYPDAISRNSYLMRSHEPLHSTLHEQALHPLSPDCTGFGDNARFLTQRELLSSSVTK